MEHASTTRNLGNVVHLLRNADVRDFDQRWVIGIVVTVRVVVARVGRIIRWIADRRARIVWVFAGCDRLVDQRVH